MVLARSNNLDFQDINGQDSNNHTHLSLWPSHHLMPNFQQVITEKYPSRQISNEDPMPIYIDCKQSGPLHVSGGLIMCDICGGIIRANYLLQHRESGACFRRANSRHEKGELGKREKKNSHCRTDLYGNKGKTCQLSDSMDSSDCQIISMLANDRPVQSSPITKGEEVNPVIEFENRNRDQLWQSNDRPIVRSLNNQDQSSISNMHKNRSLT